MFLGQLLLMMLVSPEAHFPDGSDLVDVSKSAFSLISWASRIAQGRSIPLISLGMLCGFDLNFRFDTGALLCESSITGLGIQGFILVDK